ncbi:MAG: putative sterol carrier protein [Cyclobacteriaceae bacterium]|jgi:putative sterol carrier protein
MTLEEATTKVNKLAFKNEGKVKAIINFQFEEGVIHLDDTQSPPLVNNSALEAPCTLKMTLDNFEKLMMGDLNPMMAFMSGKMKVEGEKSIAMKLAALF